MSKGSEIGNREGVWESPGLTFGRKCCPLWKQSRTEPWDDATSLQGRMIKQGPAEDKSRALREGLDASLNYVSHAPG